MKFPQLPRPLVIAVAAVLAITVPAMGATVVYANAGDIPRGTTVLGVAIGGKSHDDAVEALTAGLEEQADRLAEPVTVQLGAASDDLGEEGVDGGEAVDDQDGEGDPDGPQRWELLPADVGLAVDVEATVEQAAEGRRNPARGLLGRWLAPREVQPVVTADPELLAAELGAEAEGAGAPMTKPEIQFEGTEPVPVYPEPGSEFDPQLAADALARSWPPAEPTGVWRDPAVVLLPLAEIHPVTTAEEVDRLVEEVARPAVAAPVTAHLPDGAELETLEISPEVIAESLVLSGDKHGEIIPEVDEASLRAGLSEQLGDLESSPTDARFVVDNGAPEIVDGRPGEGVDTDELAEELLAVLPEPEPREVEANLTELDGAVTAEELAALGVEEEVGTFTTDFDGGLESPRSQNIVLMSEMVDGTLVRPGETFSLNGHTGPRGYDDGFQDAPVIIDGRLQPAVGGGLSQFTTTLFNATFYAGLEIVEHQPHSYYYSSYPAVLESTIFYDSIDFKFHNNTEYGVVIATSYTSSSISVSIWSTSVWDEVDAEWGERRNTTSPERRYVDPGPSCLDTNGIPGFTQDAWRIFYRNGEEVDREQFTWRYDAQPEVICGEDPDAEDD